MINAHYPSALRSDDYVDPANLVTVRDPYGRRHRITRQAAQYWKDHPEDRAYLVKTYRTDGWSDDHRRRNGEIQFHKFAPRLHLGNVMDILEVHHG